MTARGQRFQSAGDVINRETDNRFRAETGVTHLLDRNVATDRALINRWLSIRYDVAQEFAANNGLVEHVAVSGHGGRRRGRGFGGGWDGGWYAPEFVEVVDDDAIIGAAPLAVPLDVALAGGSYSDLFIKQFQFLLATRGMIKTGNPAMPFVPATLNVDVVPLASYWSGQRVEHPAAEQDLDKDRVNADYSAALAQLIASKPSAAPSAVYPHNATLWPVIKRIAIQVSSAADGPSKAAVASQAVEQAIHDLPARLFEVAKGAGGQAFLPDFHLDDFKRYAEIGAAVLGVGLGVVVIANIAQAVKK